jgi:hypothetical protein
LTDEDFVTFLERCKNSLDEKGLIVVKENMCKTGYNIYVTIIKYYHGWWW